jgi:hypothetical protein
LTDLLERLISITSLFLVLWDVAAPLNALPKKMDEICVEPKATAALRSLENSQLTTPCVRNG